MHKTKTAIDIFLNTPDDMILLQNLIEDLEKFYSLCCENASVDLQRISELSSALNDLLQPSPLLNKLLKIATTLTLMRPTIIEPISCMVALTEVCDLHPSNLNTAHQWTAVAERVRQCASRLTCLQGCMSDYACAACNETIFNCKCLLDGLAAN